MGVLVSAGLKFVVCLFTCCWKHLRCKPVNTIKPPAFSIKFFVAMAIVLSNKITKPKRLMTMLEITCVPFLLRYLKTYFLPTEFEVRTVRYEPSVFPFDLWPKRVARES